jgi:hypothetical protein
MHCLLLLANLLFLLVRIVRNIDFDTQLIPQPVDTRTLGTNDASDEFSVDIEFGRLSEVIRASMSCAKLC